MVTDTKSGRVVGIHICGPNASDLISEAALALEVAATAEDIALTIHPHPTLGGSRDGSGRALDRATRFTS